MAGAKNVGRTVEQYGPTLHDSKSRTAINSLVSRSDEQASD